MSKKRTIMIDMETSGLNPSNKARVINSKEISDMLKSMPLKARLNVINDMMLQDALIDMGFIPDGYWSDEKEKKYGKFHKIARNMTKHQLQEFKQWEKDGKPK